MATAGLAAAWVPGRAQLVSALPSAMRRISDVRCEGFGQDEPTEFSCRYRAIGGAGRTSRCVVYLAMDGARWIIIDGPTCRRR